MKYLVGISRILVGVLFIISGLIKLNDPLGFSFKLEEYFSPAVLDLPFLEPYALAFSLFVVILEIILGVTLLLGYKIKLTLWTLLGTILFFTFLTFYSAYFNKVTDCGCFGDAVKMTPWQSFGKDVVLLVLILILIAGERHIKPLGTPRFRLLTTLLALLACIWFGNHVLGHLPTVDFRPYKIGANIPDNMIIPGDAPGPIYEYDWKFRVGGEEKIITTLGDYPQVEGEFIGLEGTREIQAGYEPPIHDLTMEKNGLDLAPSILRRPNLLLVIAYDLAKSRADAFDPIRTLTDTALARGYSVVGLSASSEASTAALREAHDLDFPFYFTDMTALKTIVRSNPGVLLLKEGTIVQKVHFNDLDRIQLPVIPEQGRYLPELKKSLDSILELDQKYRSNNMGPEDMGRQWQLDQQDIVFIDSIMGQYGYPGLSMVGPKTNLAAWYVIQHSERIDDFLPQIEVAARTGEIPFRLYAMMLDRSLMNRNLPQIYGTQAMYYLSGTPDETRLIWPVEDAENVNARRAEAGIDATIEEYALDILEGAPYRAYSMEEVKALQERQEQILSKS